MSLARELALFAYRVCTRGSRNRCARKLTQHASWPAAVLFYHRVADTDFNDWSIGCKGFRQHLDWLGKHTKVVKLEDIQLSQSLKSRSTLEVALTFDDGYFETAENAIPAIIDRGWTCTFFVSSYFVETGLPFPHDIARNRPHRPNTPEQIRWMSAQGIEIGCHSHSHLNLGLDLSRATLRSEILDSRKLLQDLSGQPVRYFAFPFGMPENMSQEAVDTVFAAGFDGFLSAYGDWNLIGDHPYHVRRIHGQVGIQSIANWLSLDPRKFRRNKDFTYVPKGLRARRNPVLVPCGAAASI